VINISNDERTRAGDTLGPIRKEIEHIQLVHHEGLGKSTPCSSDGECIWGGSIPGNRGPTGNFGSGVVDSRHTVVLDPGSAELGNFRMNVDEDVGTINGYGMREIGSGAILVLDRDRLGGCRCQAQPQININNHPKRCSWFPRETPQ